MTKIILFKEKTIQIGPKISQGQFGTVYKGTNMESFLIRFGGDICN